jgi:hypothetical protein
MAHSVPLLPLCKARCSPGTIRGTIRGTIQLLLSFPGTIRLLLSFPGNIVALPAAAALLSLS